MGVALSKCCSSDDGYHALSGGCRLRRPADVGSTADQPQQLQTGSAQQALDGTSSLRVREYFSEGDIRLLGPNESPFLVSPLAERQSPPRFIPNKAGSLALQDHGFHDLDNSVSGLHHRAHSDFLSGVRPFKSGQLADSHGSDSGFESVGDNEDEADAFEELGIAGNAQMTNSSMLGVTRSGGIREEEEEEEGDGVDELKLRTAALESSGCDYPRPANSKGAFLHRTVSLKRSLDTLHRNRSSSSVSSRSSASSLYSDGSQERSGNEETLPEQVAMIKDGAKTTAGDQESEPLASPVPVQAAPQTETSTLSRVLSGDESVSAELLLQQQTVLSQQHDAQEKKHASHRRRRSHGGPDLNSGVSGRRKSTARRRGSARAHRRRHSDLTNSPLIASSFICMDDPCPETGTTSSWQIRKKWADATLIEPR